MIDKPGHAESLPAHNESLSGDVLLDLVLAGTHARVWRRLRVPLEATLEHLHRLIQLVFGGADDCFFRFDLGLPPFGPHSLMWVGDVDVSPTLEAFRLRIGQVVTYTVFNAGRSTVIITVQSLESADAEPCHNELDAIVVDAGGFTGAAFVEAAVVAEENDHSDVLRAMLRSAVDLAKAYGAFDTTAHASRRGTPSARGG